MPSNEKNRNLSIVVTNLRYYSKLYFHGHTVGGTNPSLLEAMASNSLIVANNNEFNASILNDDALYFESVEDVVSAIEKVNHKNDFQRYLTNNTAKINEKYTWEQINSSYLNFFEEKYAAYK